MMKAILQWTNGLHLILGWWYNFSKCNWKSAIKWNWENVSKPCHTNPYFWGRPSFCNTTSWYENDLLDRRNREGDVCITWICRHSTPKTFRSSKSDVVGQAGKKLRGSPHMLLIIFIEVLSKENEALDCNCFPVNLSLLFWPSQFFRSYNTCEVKLDKINQLEGFLLDCWANWTLTGTIFGLAGRLHTGDKHNEQSVS